MPSDPEPRAFSEWLLEQRRGLMHAELGDALRELVEAVNVHGKPGALTLKLSVKPAGKNAIGTVLVADEIKLAKPQGDRAETIFFVDAQSDLRRHDPNQLAIDVRELDEPKEPRDA